MNHVTIKTMSTILMPSFNLTFLKRDEASEQKDSVPVLQMQVVSQER